MIDNYRPGEWRETTWYGLCFDDGRNNGFEFPCDENGNPDPDMPQAAWENYHYAMAHPEKFVRYNKVIERKHSWKDHAHGTCVCGNEIDLYDDYLGACECPHCGQWWNMFGQMLNPPETWADGNDW